MGAYRVRGWAWVLFMTLAAASLTVNLLRDFFFGDPRYVPLAAGALFVFLLTPFDVQVALRRPAPHPMSVSTGRPGIPSTASDLISAVQEHWKITPMVGGG